MEKFQVTIGVSKSQSYYHYTIETDNMGAVHHLAEIRNKYQENGIRIIQYNNIAFVAEFPKGILRYTILPLSQNNIFCSLDENSGRSPEEIAGSIAELIKNL